MIKMSETEPSNAYGVAVGRSGARSVVYRTGVQKELSLQEVVDILAYPDLTKLSTMPAIKPKGGDMYLYRCPDYESRHDIRADQYVWSQQGTKKMPKDDPVLKRFYMYIRTAQPIRNIYSKRPKKTFSKYDVRFMKIEYELIEAEDQLVLVHYIGDENVWKPFRHGNSIKNDRPFVRTMRSAVKRKVLELGAVATPREVYRTMLTEHQSQPGYEAVTAPRNKEQIRNYLKFANINRRRSTTGSGAFAKRRMFQQLDDYFDDSIEMDDDMDSLSPEPPPEAFEDVNIGQTIGADPYDIGLAPIDDGDEGVLTAIEPRAKYYPLFSTFEICHNGQLQGFVDSLTILPQCAVVCANKNILDVVNDLVTLDASNKVDKFQFYYVSAGPVAGGYYLSTLLFRHCMFESEPIVPCAYLIHEHRQNNDHRRLFELIKTKCPAVTTSDCVFITDREYGGITSILPTAIHLYSWNYFEDDIVNWVENNGGTNDDAEKFLADVYALMKSRNLDRFNRELATRRKRWPSTFYNFFEIYLKPDILARGARWHAVGLGSAVYDPVTGVAVPHCNDLNQLVGELVEWNQATLEQLIQCLYHFADYYAKEIERGMHNLGGWKLHPKYAQFGKSAATVRDRSLAPFELGHTNNIINHVRMMAVTDRVGMREEVVIANTI